MLTNGSDFLLGINEWLLADLARKLEMPQATLHR